MDESKMTSTTQPKFPLVDALLFTPPETANGHIGICTNTTAPGQVFNDVAEENRSAVSVLGPLIVSRDGTERMILNSLVHPTITYLILFSEESLTFSPSTNLLLALMHGLDANREGNYIMHGQAASAHFPNLSKRILDLFRDNIVVLPLFMSQNKQSSVVVAEYLTWLGERVPHTVLAFLKEANAKDKKYYDTLNKLITLLRKFRERKPSLNLTRRTSSTSNRQRLRLRRTEQHHCAFSSFTRNNLLRLDITVGDTSYFIRGDTDFRIEYSL